MPDWARHCLRNGLLPTVTPQTVPCPNCGGPADASPDNQWRPFCSRRCKLIDLGEWLSEEHHIPDKGGGDGAGLPWSDPGEHGTH